MASIYNRDNINYGSMLENAIRNRLQYIKNKADNTRKQGELWGNFVTNTGSRLGDAYYAYKDSPEARLAALKKELAEATSGTYTHETNFDDIERKLKAYDASESMYGYAPDQSKSYSDYLAYVNGITGNGVYGMEDFYRRGR